MAVISKVLICRMALSAIGAGSIEALDDNTAAASECTTWYDYSRLQALESHNWSFARKRQALAAHSDDPPDSWSFRYQYPADSIIIRRLQNPILGGTVNAEGFVLGTAGDRSDAIPFEIELDDDQDAKSILTDLDSAVAVYTFDQSNTALFSPYFVRMLSAQLAGNIAYALTAKPELEDKMFARFTTLQLAAPAFNANEGMQSPPRDADWIRGR